MKKKVKKYVWISVILLLIILGITLYIRTGILQMNKIDKRDLAKWEYQEGVMKNAEEFFVDGNKNTCWMLIHGYTATPNEMQELADRISSEFNDYIYVPRMEGHGEVPSHLAHLSLENWYPEIEKKFEKLNKECNQTNVAGFSFGGAITLKLAEEKNLKNIYAIDPYLKPADRWYFILPLNIYLDAFSDIFLYVKKNQIAQINSPEGQERYLSYWNFPLQPVKNSKQFLKIVRENLKKINEPILILHSKGDMTAHYKESVNAIETVSSENKKIVLFEKSNHVLLYDYEGKEAIEEIIKFEKQNR
jgi:carboxylesterase